MFKWIKKLRKIVKDYESHQRYVENEIAAINKLVREVTDVHADISATPYHPSTVIVIGRFKGRDHVEIFQIRDQELEHIIRTLRDMRRYAKMGRIDAPISMRGMIDHELKY